LGLQISPEQLLKSYLPDVPINTPVILPFFKLRTLQTFDGIVQGSYGMTDMNLRLWFRDR
jgi:hypothetical protein